MVSRVLVETAWAGAALNLFLYMLASHFFGAFWYLFSIEHTTNCWERACAGRSADCILRSSFRCEANNHTAEFVQILDRSCPIETPNRTLFDFGIFLDALQSCVVRSKEFPEKFFYCFWWGLQNLSSLGQNLKTSTYVPEICLAMSVSIAGLVLFCFLIGNMQRHLQSAMLRVEERRVKRQDAERWMEHRVLPEGLRERIRRYEQYKWQETRGVDEDNLIRSLPKDLRRDVKRHLCLALVKRVPMFEKLDDRVMDATCDRLKPVLYIENSSVVREGDPVNEVIFVIRGKLFSSTTDNNGGRMNFSNLGYLKAGDYCGEELLTWALDPNSSSELPASARTVRALSEVEAYALVAEDAKFVASQFRRSHRNELRHAFRFYLRRWRTWAACFIQAAWRRYCNNKKRIKEEEESRLLRRVFVVSDDNVDTNCSFGSSSLKASRFSANGTMKTRMSEEIMPPMFLRKPPEPDFGAVNR